MTRFRRPSPSMVISLIALFVAMGGTGYAAIKLPKNSVKAKQIASGAVGASEVKNGSLKTGDLSSGARNALRGLTGATGPQGPTGATGATGPAGPSDAWSSGLTNGD